MKRFFLFICIALFLGGCSFTEKPDDDYVIEIQKWHKARIRNLKAPDGWLTLTGLHWLQEGENTIGSSSDNDIVFPKDMPRYLGTIFKTGENISIKIDILADVFCGEKRVQSSQMESDALGKPTVLQWETYSWYIIKRGDRYGIRLKNSNSPYLTEFKGVNLFPIHQKWKVKATLEKSDSLQTVRVPDVLGDVNDRSCPGALVFNLENEEFRLYPLGDDSTKLYFLIFADETNGEQTYGAGRFLSIPAVDSTGTTYIDFNQATNPPCVFTPYATCPLPPEQNYLPVKIKAGEKMYKNGVHH